MIHNTTFYKLFIRRYKFIDTFFYGAAIYRSLKKEKIIAKDIVVLPSVEECKKDLLTHRGESKKPLVSQ